MLPLDSKRSLTNVGCGGNSQKYHLTPKSLWCRFCRGKTGGRSLPRVSGTGRRLFEQAAFHSRFRNMFLLLSESESILFRIPILLGWVTNMVSCSQADRKFCMRLWSVFGTWCKNISQFIWKNRNLSKVIITGLFLSTNMLLSNHCVGISFFLLSEMNSAPYFTLETGF